MDDTQFRKILDFLGYSWSGYRRVRKGVKKRIQIIFLRNNILTYCRQTVQIRAFQRIMDCLTPGGLLITGCHESLPVDTGALIPMSECQYVYTKR